MIIIAWIGIALLVSCTGTLFEDINNAVQTYKSVNAFHVTDKQPQRTSVPVNTVVTVTFSAEVNPSTITGNVILEIASTNTPIAGGIMASKDTVTFTPSWNLAGMTEYRVTVSKAVTDTSGTGLREDNTWNFTTSNASAPVVSIIIDADNAYSTDSDVSLTLHTTDDTTPAGEIQMRYSNSATYDNSGWKSHKTSILSWLLVPGEGTKTVYVWFKDAQGNVSYGSSSYHWLQSVR